MPKSVPEVPLCKNNSWFGQITLPYLSTWQPSWTYQACNLNWPWEDTKKHRKGQDWWQVLRRKVSSLIALVPKTATLLAFPQKHNTGTFWLNWSPIVLFQYVADNRMWRKSCSCSRMQSGGASAPWWECRCFCRLGVRLDRCSRQLKQLPEARTAASGTLAGCLSFWLPRCSGTPAGPCCSCLSCKCAGCDCPWSVDAPRLPSALAAPSSGASSPQLAAAVEGFGADAPLCALASKCSISSGVRGALHTLHKGWWSTLAPARSVQVECSAPVLGCKHTGSTE